MARLHQRVRRTPQNTQYSYAVSSPSISLLDAAHLPCSRYSLDRRIHDVKTYPVLSPQGATIIIFGHETGITLVWRGGRRLKPTEAEQPSAKSKQNGGSGDAVMIIDSDDDEAPSAPTAPFVDKPEFEDDGSDAGSAYPEIVQTLDLELGQEVLHVAVPPMTPCTASDAGPTLLQQKMVFAVSCATNDAFVFTLPLTPPSQESKERQELRTSLLAGRAGKGKWGETVVSLVGQARSSDGLAMTIVKQRTSSSERSKSPARPRPGTAAPVTRVVVAAHSREASGTLRLWDVAVNAKASSEDRRVEPFQTEYLPSPLTGVAFNPVQNTQLLATASPHAVRIYDYTIPSIPPDDISEGPFPSQGSWLLSLYPPFARGSLSSTARKPIIAAAWVAHGRAVLTLLADGQWGIWDIDGSGPSTNEGGTSLLSRAGSGVRGAALTAFSATGQLEGTSPLRNPTARRSEADFVPMTPHTRRDVLGSSLVGGAERLASIRGNVEVVQLPSLRGTGGADESAVLWLGGADHVVAVIPSISRFWDTQVRKSAGGGVNLFSGAQPSRMIRLADLATGLMGERCSGIGAVAHFPRRFLDEDDVGEEGLPIEVLVKGETRVVVVRESDHAAAPLFERPRKRGVGPAPAKESASAVIAHPRSDRPIQVSFDLSVSKKGSLREPQPQPDPGPSQESLVTTAGSSFDSHFAYPQGVPFADEVTLTRSMMVPDVGLRFAVDLDSAANAADDEEAADDRNVEEEMLDIIEIDRALEEMEEDHTTGTKHVFFETE